MKVMLAPAIVLKTDAAGKCSQGSLSAPAGAALGLVAVAPAQTPSNTFPPSFAVFKTKAAVSLTVSVSMVYAGFYG